jgi:hypothetical protein
MIDAEISKVFLECIAGVFAAIVRTNDLQFPFSKPFDPCQPLLEIVRCIGFVSQEVYPGVPRTIVHKHHHISRSTD